MKEQNNKTGKKKRLKGKKAKKFPALGGITSNIRNPETAVLAADNQFRLRKSHSADVQPP